MSFSIEIRVYAQDTDFGGVVHHTNYLRFMERARSEWAYQRGVRLNDLGREGFYFVVRDASIRYRRGARLGDQLNIVCKLKRIGKASMVYEQRIEAHDDPHIIYASAEITMAFVGDDFKPKAIPSHIKEAFNNEQ